MNLAPFRAVIAGTVVAVALFLAGCAGHRALAPATEAIDQGRLPPPDIALDIPGLGPCTDRPDRTLHLNAKQPVTVLVHGCFASSGRFRGLAQVLAFHGQQSACFTYNDRDSLKASAGQLSSALEQLAQRMDDKHLTLIGHSQGALIARRSMVKDGIAVPGDRALQVRLVTISGPFMGIAAAAHCGNPGLKVLSLGLVSVACRIVTGDKWSEITYSSDFIRHPGRLNAQVRDYLKIETDERGSCRRYEKQACVESDSVFSLAEQHNPAIDSDPVTRREEVKAGHVEIVGDQRVAPVKLIAILQRYGIINPTEPQRTADLDRLLRSLYGAAN